MSDMAGTPLGSAYVIFFDQLLGRGAMGRVYVGERRSTRERLAIKVLRSELSDDPEIVARFLQERTVLTGLEHPGLVRVHDLVLEAGTAAVVMDLVVGTDLRRILVEREVLTDLQVALVGSEILEALSIVHTRGIVHRDVKPENVLIDEMGHSHLTDFGIAKIASTETLTRLTGLIGTPQYIAPEAIEGGVRSPESDVYSCGIMLFEALTGATPFAGSAPLATLRRHAEEMPVLPASIDPAVADLLSTMLAKDRGARPSAREAAAMFRELSTSLVWSAVRSADASPTPRTLRKSEKAESQALRETQLSSRRKRETHEPQFGVQPDRAQGRAAFGRSRESTETMTPKQSKALGEMQSRQGVEPVRQGSGHSAKPRYARIIAVFLAAAAASTAIVLYSLQGTGRADVPSMATFEKSLGAQLLNVYGWPYGPPTCKPPASGWVAGGTFQCTLPGDGGSENVRIGSGHSYSWENAGSGPPWYPANW